MCIRDRPRGEHHVVRDVYGQIDRTHPDAPNQAFELKGRGNAYFFFIFFGFFAFFFYYHLEKDGVDERLLENRKRAAAVMLSFFTLLSFALLFLLDRQVPADTVLLVGSLGYAAGFVLAPALTLFFDRKAD